MSEIRNVGPVSWVAVVDALPSSGELGQEVDLSTDGKRYRHNGTTWVELGGGSGGSTISGSEIGAFSAYKTSAQSAPNGTSVVVPYNVKEFDTSNWYNATTGRYQPQVAGIYRFNAGIYFTSPTGVSLILQRSGGSGVNSKRIDERYNQPEYGAYGSADFYLNGSTDYVEVIVNQTTGGARTIDVTSAPAQLSFFQGARVGSALGSPVGERVIRGIVNGDGTILAGTGFTVTRNATGQYIITFAVPFSGPIVPEAMIYGDGGGAARFCVANPGNNWVNDGTSLRVGNLRNDAGAWVDGRFAFTARASDGGAASNGVLRVDGDIGIAGDWAGTQNFSNRHLLATTAAGGGNWVLPLIGGRTWDVQAHFLTRMTGDYGWGTAQTRIEVCSTAAATTMLEAGGWVQSQMHYSQSGQGQHTVRVAESFVVPAGETRYAVVNCHSPTPYGNATYRHRDYCRFSAVSSG